MAAVKKERWKVLRRKEISVGALTFRRQEKESCFYHEDGQQRR